MSAHQEVKVKQSSEGDDATTIPLDVIHHQSEFFDKLKQFLLSQQNSLRQNLETVKEKTGKSTLTRNQVNINGERSKESDPSNPSTNSSNSEAPVATQRKSTQIRKTFKFVHATDGLIQCFSLTIDRS